jgi:hypothetical protein
VARSLTVYSCSPQAVSRAAVSRVAVPPEVTTVPSVSAPSVKVTDPPSAMPSAPVMVAVRVTAWPYGDGRPRAAGYAK